MRRMLFVSIKILLLLFCLPTIKSGRKGVSSRELDEGEGGLTNSERPQQGQAMEAGTKKKARPKQIGTQISYEGMAELTHLHFLNQQRQFLAKWIELLGSDEDMKAGKFLKAIGQSFTGDDYFNSFNRKMSSVAKAANAKLFFMSVGACDGSEDPTIKLFLKNLHWEAMFVEPMDLNVRDLRLLLNRNGAMNRSTIIQAAATAQCKKTTLTFSRPLFEQINKTNEHWLRRQIGGVIEKGSRADWNDWKDETVWCTTGQKLIADWSDRYYYKLVAKGQTRVSHYRTSPQSRTKRRLRPHILRVDVEGHDFEVLKGFLQDSSRLVELPLTILFEAKVVGVWHKANTTFADVQRLLRSAGYIVTDEHHDSFAVLRPDRIVVPGSPAAGVAASNQLSSDQWTLGRYRQQTGQTRDPPADKAGRGSGSGSKRGRGGGDTDGDRDGGAGSGRKQTQKARSRSTEGESEGVRSDSSSGEANQQVAMPRSRTTAATTTERNASSDSTSAADGEKTDASASAAPRLRKGLGVNRGRGTATPQTIVAAQQAVRQFSRLPAAARTTTTARAETADGAGGGVGARGTQSKSRTGKGAAATATKDSRTSAEASE